MAMNEELLASIDDRLIQLVEEMKLLRKHLAPGFTLRDVPELQLSSDPPQINNIPDPPQKTIITRRLGLSPEKKSDPIAEAFKARTGITLPPRLF